jgi:NitT/TauT family transport system permease protein
MKPILRVLAGFALLLVIWQILAGMIQRSVIVPAPAETLPLMGQLLLSVDTLAAVWQTTWKVLLALALAILTGLPVGLALGLSKRLYDLFRPLLMVVQAVPVVSWLSLVIFTWGLGWRGPVFIGFLSLAPIAVLTTVSGVRSLDQNLLEMARLYRVPRWKVFQNIYLGSLLPFIAAILDVSIGQAWKVILVAEYLSGSGLGVAVLMARMNVDAPQVWALTFIAVLLGVLSESLIKSLTRKGLQRWTIS